MNYKFTPRYDIRIAPTDCDTYPNNFKCWVSIIDATTGTRYKRRGYGRYMGNYSPIWISLHGKSYQLTELERVNLYDES